MCEESLFSTLLDANMKIVNMKITTDIELLGLYLI